MIMAPADPKPLITEVYALLPPGLRADLGIVNVAAASPSRVRFRLDPGHMFLLRGQLLSSDRGLSAGVWVQHRPDEQLTWVTSASVGPIDLAETLRNLIDRSLGYGPGAHWLDIYHHQAPAWTRPWAPQQFDEAQSFATSRARAAGVACYLWREAKEFTTGNNPSQYSPFYSVTPIAEWSRHDEGGTLPLETAPDRGAFDGMISQRAALLSAHDRLTTELSATERTRQRLRTSRPPRER
jgi:hypothetical protein